MIGINEKNHTTYLKIPYTYVVFIFDGKCLASRFKHDILFENSLNICCFYILKQTILEALFQKKKKITANFNAVTRF